MRDDSTLGSLRSQPLDCRLPEWMQTAGGGGIELVGDAHAFHCKTNTKTEKIDLLTDGNGTIRTTQACQNFQASNRNEGHGGPTVSSRPHLESKLHG